jgi:integrase
MGKLTDAVIRKLNEPGYYPDGDGLFLQVTRSADGSPRRSWLCRYTAPEGRRREAGLGRYPDVSLSRARDRAQVMRDEAWRGVDPLAERDSRKAQAVKKAATAMSFAQAAEAYVSLQSLGWRSVKHRKQWLAALVRHIYPVFGDLPVGDVDVAVVLRALEPIWTSRPDTASRLRQRIEAILDWATVRGLRTGENPARWRGHLEKALPRKSDIRKVQHHPALPFADLPAFWQAMSERFGTGADALRFAILTAARSGEVRGARWGEIDMTAGVWIIPDTRMKTGREHRVPLAPEALEILQWRLSLSSSTPAPEALVFASDTRPGSPISDMTMTAVLKRMDRADLTAHGFRSTFRDWCAERTNFPRELAEAALSHTVGDAVERAYRRGDALDKRRALMAAWGKFATSPQVAGEVVSLRAGRRTGGGDGK